MLEWIHDPQAWTALATLTALEIVLGIDNIVFISILSSKLPEEEQSKARRIGLLLALASRIILLFSISLLMKLTQPLFELFGKGYSGKDLILFGGGLFLIGKATVEIHEKIEGHGHKDGRQGQGSANFAGILFQIMLLDVIFSLDSVITAVGMAKHLEVMVIAVVIAVIFMLVFVDKVSAFVTAHPTVKVLALSFLIMVGLALVGEGAHFHIPKGYIYFSMAFSIFVEMVNLRVRHTESKNPPKTA